MDTEINNLRSHAIEGMQSYLNAFTKDGDNPGYSEEDIDACKSIIDSFLESLREVSVGNDQIVMAAIKKAVLALNALNEKCDYSIIETDQREDLAMLIIKAAALAGVGDGACDITEEWREW
jgi:hypothetical protein